MTIAPSPALDRRTLLFGAGALVVSVALPDVVAAAGVTIAPAGLATRPALKPDQLASYIGVLPDGSAVAYFGKVDGGQGTDMGIAQIVAEELDLPATRVAVLMGDTAMSMNQGGASGSTGIAKGGAALRSAAAEARRVLVALAAERLGLSADELAVEDGVVHSKADPTRRVSYGELIGGRFFDVVVKWNGKIGNDLFVSGPGKPKHPSDCKVVGTSPRRTDVAWKVMGTGHYVGDVKVPGMIHARMVLPAIAGAVPVAVDRDSLSSIPGAQVVWDKGFLAVAAPREWDAIRAAEALTVRWSDAAPPFPGNAGLADVLRDAKPVKTSPPDLNSAAVEAAFAAAHRVVEAEYHWPFQSHASMAPACALADVRADGATVWTSSQKPHYARDGVAALLGLPPEAVHGVWMPGPGSYGRNDAGDTVVAAALISKALGKPVRLQGMRHEGHGWDPKAPASMHVVRAALDADGAVTAWDYGSKGFSRLEVESNESDPAQTLAGQMLGMPLRPTFAFNAPEESYSFPKRKTWATVAGLLDRASPLRSSHMRDPLGPQIHFASESFMDELAEATGTDPVAFRLRHLGDARDRAVVEAAAAKAEWQPRVGARRLGTAALATGQGVAYAQRGGTRVCVVADVDVNRTTGKVHARRYTVAHDAGLIVNPTLLRLTIEGNLVQGTSRSLWEEVTFDAANVTSVDWLTYPILDMTEAPERIDIVLIDHPEIASTGAGEAAMRPVAAALANAIYDATGVRQRQAPFTPARVRAGFA